MSDKKKYIITAVTLGIIAACSGGLIGVTNLITKDRIAQNEKNKFNAGIVAIFGENCSASVLKEDLSDSKFLNVSYTVSDGEDTQKGWAVKATGSNSYGKISMIVGFDVYKVRIGTYMITNEQTYATTLIDNYVTPLNEGARDLDDVSCGATFGAKLVRDMINEAQSYVDGIIED